MARMSERPPQRWERLGLVELGQEADLIGNPHAFWYVPFTVPIAFDGHPHWASLQMPPRRTQFAPMCRSVSSDDGEPSCCTLWFFSPMSPSCGCPGFTAVRSRSGDSATGRPLPLTSPAAASYRYGLFADQVQPEHPRRISLVEVAEHGVSRHLLQVVPVLSLREDAVAKCASFLSAFVGFGHLEDDLGDSHCPFPFVVRPRQVVQAGPPMISASSPSAPVSKPRISARIPSSVRIGCGW